jgi:hypothetical protein
MPYDPGPQRRVKAQAMVDALDRARLSHDPARSWVHVLDRLLAYSPGDWRVLSVAAGRPDRIPSPETRVEVTAAVRARAEAEHDVGAR